METYGRLFGSITNMIDTVILEIPIVGPTTQKLIDPATFENWTPNLGQVLNNYPISAPVETAVLNPATSVKQKLLQGYQPRLTVRKQMNSKGGFRWYMYIEFSVQKLLFGNNYQEVSDSDFSMVCSKLEAFLKGKGVNLPAKEVAGSICKTVHYAKNCIVSNTHDAILGLHKADFRANFGFRQNKRLDEYYGGGMGLNVYIQKRSLSFYDKNAELKQSIKSGDQPSLTTQDLQKMNRKQILRMEFRLEDKLQICKFLGVHGFEVDEQPKFSQVYGEKQAKTILRSELGRIDESWFWDSTVNSVQDVKRFMRKGLSVGNSQGVSVVATVSLLANQYGADEAKVILGRQWGQAKRTVKKLKMKFVRNPYLDEVIKEVDEFNLVRTI